MKQKEKRRKSEEKSLHSASVLIYLKAGKNIFWSILFPSFGCSQHLERNKIEIIPIGTILVEADKIRLLQKCEFSRAIENHGATTLVSLEKIYTRVV